MTFKLIRARDLARLPVNLAQIRSAVPETFHTQTKSYGQRQKQNLAQFTACDNETTLTCSRRMPTKASAEGAVRRGAVTSTQKLTFYFFGNMFCVYYSLPWVNEIRCLGIYIAMLPCNVKKAINESRLCPGCAILVAMNNSLIASTYNVTCLHWFSCCHNGFWRCSRSLYAVARLSVCRLSVSLSVKLVHPTQAVVIFRNILRHLVPWPSFDIRENFYGDRPRGPPPWMELNTTGVAKYSDFGPIEGCMWETVQDRR